MWGNNRHRRTVALPLDLQGFTLDVVRLIENRSKDDATVPRGSLAGAGNLRRHCAVVLLSIREDWMAELLALDMRQRPRCNDDHQLEKLVMIAIRSPIFLNALG